MSGTRFTLIFSIIFALGALPLILVQSLGAASAGLSTGMMLPLSNPGHMLLFLAVGLLASQMSVKSYLMLPAAFLLMMSIGMFTDFTTEDVPLSKLLILGAILCYGVIAHNMSLSAFILSTLFSSIIAFTLGAEYAAIIPNIALPLYFLLGVLLSTSFILMGGLCLGLTLSGMFGIQLSTLMPEWTKRYNQALNTRLGSKPLEAPTAEK